MKQKPNLNFWKLWNLSFGFFGVQLLMPYKGLISHESLLHWEQTRIVWATSGFFLRSWDFSFSPLWVH